MPDKEPSAAASVSECGCWCGQGSALSLYQGVVWRGGPGEVVTPSSDKVQSSAASCWAAAKPSFALGPDVNSRPARSRQPIKRLSLARVPPCRGRVTPRHVSPPRHHDQLFSPRLLASPVFTPIFVPPRPATRCPRWSGVNKVR